MFSFKFEQSSVFRLERHLSFLPLKVVLPLNISIRIPKYKRANMHSNVIESRTTPWSWFIQSMQLLFIQFIEHLQLEALTAWCPFGIHLVESGSFR